MNYLLIGYGLIGVVVGAIAFVIASDDYGPGQEFSPLQVAIAAGVLWPVHLILLSVNNNE